MRMAASDGEKIRHISEFGIVQSIFSSAVRLPVQAEERHCGAAPVS